MCGVRIWWEGDDQKLHTGHFGLIEDDKTLTAAQQSVNDELHLWFVARDGRIFGIPSGKMISIKAEKDG